MPSATSEVVKTTVPACPFTVVTGGTYVIYGGNATTTNTIDAADTISVADIRNAVTELRTNKALPRLGELYAAYLHPRQAADLRAESGTGGFQDIVKYTDNVSKTIIPGSVGVIEGAFVVETPRVPFAANTNSPAVNVYKAVVSSAIPSIRAAYKQAFLDAAAKIEAGEIANQEQWTKFIEENAGAKRTEAMNKVYTAIDELKLPVTFAGKEKELAKINREISEAW